MSRAGLFGLSAALAVGLAGHVVAAPAAWSVDKARSRLGFRGVIEGEAFDGVFRRWDADIRFDPNDLARSTVAVSVDTTSAFTNHPDRDETLPTQEWLSVKTFPRATFVVRRFDDLGGGRYRAIGELTLKGVKRPVVLPFTLAIKGQTAKMAGSVVLDRTTFGVGSGRWKSEEMVATGVTVTVNLTASRAR